MKQFLILIIIITISIHGYSQESLNAYKYVVIDNQYEFQGSANEYRLNEQMVFELVKKNFKAFRNTEVLPDDMNQGACNTLQINVKVSTGLQTKMEIEFVDCDNNLIYGPLKGNSRLKNFEKDYRASLRKAINSLEDYTHNYEESDEISTKKVTTSSATGTDVKPGSKTDQSESIRKKTYTSSKGLYAIQEQGSDFIILKNNNVIGTLKQSSSGCYLAVTTDFIGIGVQEGDNIKIEFEKEGTQVLEFEKQ